MPAEDSPISWRTARRIAWHDVRRARIRTALTVALLVIPLLAGLAAAVAFGSSARGDDTNAADHLGARLVMESSPVAGAADAHSRRELDRRIKDAGFTARWWGERYTDDYGTIAVFDDVETLRRAHYAIKGDVPNEPGEALALRGYASANIGDQLTWPGGSALVVGRGASLASLGFRHDAVALVDDFMTHHGDGAALQGAVFGDGGDVAGLRRDLEDAGFRVSVAASPPVLVPASYWDYVQYENTGADSLTPLLLIAIGALVIGVLVAPSFFASRESFRLTLHRLSENGAGAAARRRVMVCSALLMTGVAAVVATTIAAFIAPLARWIMPFAVTEWFIYNPLGLGLDVLGLAWGAVAASVAVSALLVTRETAGHAPMTTVRPLLAAGACGALTIAATARILTSPSGVSAEGPLALGAIITGILTLIFASGPLVRVPARMGWGLPGAWRFAARDNARNARRAAPVFAALTASAGVLVAGGALLMTPASSGDAAILRAVFLNDIGSDGPVDVEEIRAGLPEHLQAAPARRYGSGEIATGRAACDASGVCAGRPAAVYLAGDSGYIECPDTSCYLAEILGHSVVEVAPEALADYFGLSAAQAREVAAGRSVVRLWATEDAGDELRIVGHDAAGEPVVRDVFAITAKPADARAVRYDESVYASPTVTRGMTFDYGSVDGVFVTTTSPTFTIDDRRAILAATGFGYDALSATAKDVVWLLSAVYAGIVTVFATLVVVLSTRQMLGTFGTLRALGATRGFARRTAMASTFLLAAPATALGAGAAVAVIYALFTTASSGYDALGHSALVPYLVTIDWVPLLACAFAVPVVVTAVVGLATIPPVTTRRART